ncbi:MAG: DAK2 domain-containing protein [Brevefilum sp.]|nr:DAK2 domain-containing protein [Brevefilum sp.]
MDLSTIFESVTAQLTDQQSTLNEADTYNHDHGDHMVQIFSLIQNAVSQKSEQPVAEQLNYASQVVEKEADSGSAKLYAQGLAKAAQNFSGSELQPDTLGLLVKSLLNVEEPPQKKQETGFLGSLLSGLMGKPETPKEDQKLGIDELLRAGMAFYQSKQEGGSTTEALMGALMAASPLGASSHRSMSGSLVGSTIMDFAKSFKN